MFDYIASLYAAIPPLGITQLLILGAMCALIALIYLVIVLPERPPQMVTKSMLDARIRAIVEQSQPMPLEPGVQAGRRHVRAGSIE